MTYESQKIEFYRLRTFSEKMGATFDFIRENWRLLFKYISVLALPISIVQGFATNNMITSADSDAGIVIYYCLLLFITIVCSVLTSSIVYSLMMIYNQRPAGLIGVVWADVSELFRTNCWRMTKITLLSMVLSVAAVLVVGGLYLLTPFTLVVTVPVGLWFFIPFLLVPPVYVFEQSRLSTAMSKGYSMGFAAWWSILGFMLLLVVILYVVTMLVSLPFTVTMTLGNILGNQGEGATLWGVVGFLSAAIAAYISYLLSPIAIVGLAYVYSHLAEKIFGYTVEHDLQTFDTTSAEELNVGEDTIIVGTED